MNATVEPSQPPVDGYRLEAVEIDLRRQVLRVDGHEVAIEPKPLALLVALAEADGCVLGKQALLDRLWPRQVVTDAVLNQCALRARQALGAIGHRAIVTVHRKGYRLGLPVQRIAAPAAAGAVVEASTHAPPVAYGRSHRVRWRTAGIAMAVLVAALAALFMRYGRVERPAVASVAMMPIEARDGSAEDARIAAGFGDALLTRLAQRADLRVPARTSVHLAAEHRDDVRRVGRELDVDHLLEAVLRRDGDGYVLHASLVRSNDGFQQWARRFDISPGGLAAAEVAVVQAVVEALSNGASAQAPPSAIGTDSEAAYKAFLDANALRNQRTAASLRWSIERYGEALSDDPAFASAHAGLGMAWLLLYEYSNLSLREASHAARNHIDEALRLQPDLADGHAALGLLHLNLGDATAAEQALRRAVVLERGNATALMWLGTALTYQGRIAEAADWHAQALAIDPLSAVAETYAGVDRALALDARAIRHFERAIALDPRLLETHWQHALFERFRGAPAAAERPLRTALAIDPGNEYTRSLLADTLLADDRADEAAVLLGQGGDGSLAFWLRTAIAVAEARRDEDRARALQRLSVDRDMSHPDDRLLVAFARQRLGQVDAALDAFDAHIAASGRNEPFLQLGQPDIGLAHLIAYLGLVRERRGEAAARTAIATARERLDAFAGSGVRIQPLTAARSALDVFEAAGR